MILSDGLVMTFTYALGITLNLVTGLHTSSRYVGLSMGPMCRLEVCWQWQAQRYLWRKSESPTKVSSEDSTKLQSEPLSYLDWRMKLFGPEKDIRGRAFSWQHWRLRSRSPGQSLCNLLRSARALGAWCRRGLPFSNLNVVYIVHCIFLEVCSS